MKAWRTSRLLIKKHWSTWISLLNSLALNSVPKKRCFHLKLISSALLPLSASLMKLMSRVKNHLVTFSNTTKAMSLRCVVSPISLKTITRITDPSSSRSTSMQQKMEFTQSTRKRLSPIQMVSEVKFKLKTYFKIKLWLQIELFKQTSQVQVSKGAKHLQLHQLFYCLIHKKHIPLYIRFWLQHSGSRST